MDDSFFDISVELKNDLDKRIASAFNVYDHGRNLMIDDLDVGNILRSMGCVPTESEINEIIKETEFENFKGRIHLSRFLPHIKELLYENKMMPATTKEILEAFKVLDPKGRGYLYKNEFLHFMNEFGETFDENQMKTMINAAVDEDTNRMDYELYTFQLAYQPSADKDIYELAKQFKNEKIEKSKNKK